MDWLRDKWDALPDVLGFVERFFRYLWTPDEPPVGLPLFGFLFAVIVTIWRLRHRANELEKWFAKYYEEPSAALLSKPDAIQAFYGLVDGRQVTPLIYASAGISLKRAVLPDILARLREDVPFKHLHIEGGRNEGKTTLLAQVAAAITPGDDMLVAYHRDSDQLWNGLDATLLFAHWRRSNLPVVYWYRRKHLLVLLDEVVGLDDKPPSADERSTFFSQLAAKASPSHRIRLVTASNHRLVNDCQQIKLSLLPVEEKRLLAHLLEQKVIDIGNNYSPIELIVRTGGRRRFKNSLKAFLSTALIRLRDATASRVIRLEELAAEDRPHVKKAITIVAACQLLDIEVPDSLLSHLVKVPHDKLMAQTHAWIRMRPLSFIELDVERDGAALTAPHLAALVLREQDMFGVGLQGVYEDIFRSTLPVSSTNFIHREFLRHILARMLKPGRASLPDRRAHEIATTLLKRFDKPLDKLLDGLDGLQDLSGWLATLTRAQDSRAKMLVARAFDAIRRGVRPGCAVITQLTSSITKLGLPISNEELALLNPIQVLSPKSNMRETNRRRQNEVVTVHCELLSKLGRKREALHMIEQAEEWVVLDTKSLITKAQIQTALSPSTAIPTYQMALRTAEKQASEGPESLITANRAFGKFIRKHQEVIDAFNRQQPAGTPPLNAEHFSHIADLLVKGAKDIDEDPAERA